MRAFSALRDSLPAFARSTPNTADIGRLPSAASRSCTASGERRTPAAPAFSRMRSALRVPGMGTIQGFLQSIQARLICAGVAPFSAARRRSRSSSARFWSTASSANWGMAAR